MRRQKQLSFDGFKRPRDEFGGSLLKNSHAKTKRPLEDRFPIFLTLHSVQNRMRLPKNYKRVNEIVDRVCKKHGIKIYRYRNMGNHLHLLIRMTYVWMWAAFIRELTGRIAQVAQGIIAQQKALQKFWSQRPHTAIIRSWRKGFQNIKEYLDLNGLEAEGHISRKDLRTLKEYRAFISDW